MRGGHYPEGEKDKGTSGEKELTFLGDIVQQLESSEEP